MPPTKCGGKSGGTRVSVDLDADQVANLEKIAKARKIKTLGETIKRLIREAT